MGRNAELMPGTHKESPESNFVMADSGAGVTGNVLGSQVISIFTEFSGRVGSIRERIKEGIAVKKAEVDNVKREVEMDEHMLALDDLCARLDVDFATGLSPQEAELRLLRDGRNELSPPARKSRFTIFLIHMFGGFAAALWVAAVLCFVSYILQETLVNDSTSTSTSVSADLVCGIVLVIVCTLSGTFAFYQDNKSFLVMEGFKRLTPQTCQVLRAGQKCTMDAALLVKGDVVYVSIGDRVPADLRVVEAQSFKVDNSSLTGESEPQSRKPECTNENPLETANIAFYSTHALEGHMVGIVVNTGDQTVIGRIASLVNTSKKHLAPMELEIRFLVKILSVVAVLLGLAFAGIGFLLGDPWYANIVLFVGILVANVPEGLLPTITVSLTLAAKRMVKKQVLIKDLQAIETLGRTGVICSDKTGTLTENRLSVAHAWLNDQEFDASSLLGPSSVPENGTLQKLLQASVLCNRSTEDTSTDKSQHRTTAGEAVDLALNRFAAIVLGPTSTVANLRARFPKVAELPFNSANKFHLSVHATTRASKEAEDRALVIVKGAPERILARCSSVCLDGSANAAQTVELTEPWRERIDGANRLLAERGERVVALAMAWLDGGYPATTFAFDVEKMNFPVADLSFVGLVSFTDPPRPGVPLAITRSHDAGVKVVMITGDHPVTAEAIARQVGILQDEVAAKGDVVLQIGFKARASAEKVRPIADLKLVAGDVADGPEDDGVDYDVSSALVVHGDELKLMTDEQLDHVLRHTQLVFARTTPQQKLQIVEGLQRRGLIVAVTGDGVNDSPALRQANIGVAMGINGSDVAKEVSDLILLDDDFSSIVNGIEEGRLIFHNLKKSIAYTLSSKVPEMMPFLFYAIFQIPTAISAVLILCVDVGTDILPAISLAYEPPEADLMRRPPRAMNDPASRLIAPKLLIYSYLQLGLLQSLSGFVNYGVVMANNGYSASDLFYNRSYWMNQAKIDPTFWYEAQSAYFVGVVICRMVVLLVSETHTISFFNRSRKLFRNYYLVAGLVLNVVLMVLLVYVPPINSAFGTAPLPWFSWIIPIPFAALIFVYDETRKWLLRNSSKPWVVRICSF